MSDRLDIDLYTLESDLNSTQDEIVIEITGLKSINKFIGLEDTPIYYDNGKFFKVQDSKIVYTDITWEDIKGNIYDNPEIINEIEKLVEETSKTYTIKIVDEAIIVHNNNEEAHPYIQQTIENNYQILNNKIDLNKLETDEDIKKVNERVDTNDKQIEDLQSFTNDIRSDLDSLTLEVEVDVKNSITALDEKVDGININLTKQIDDLEQDVNDKYNELVRDIDDLTDVVEEDYTKLNTKIDTTAQTINTRITNVADELNQTIEDNVVALQQEDTALQNQINTHSQQITKEISDRTNADTTLNNRITEVAEDLNATIEENVTALQQADTNLQSQITTNKNDISDLTQVVQDDYDELKGLIDQEIEDRQSADENLQEQIDAIVASADVKDIVGTYAQLQAYDKSTLGDNDIIKVLNDETQENASTYYRFSVSTQLFTYIGKEGPFYTKSETDVLLNVKANDSEVVHLTGNETINGIKTFSSTPIISSGYLNLNNTGNVSIQKQGTNFIRQNATGATIISSSRTDNKIYLRPHGDINSTNEVTIDSSGSVVAPKFYGPLEGTATKAIQDADGNVIIDTYATKDEVDTKQNITDNALATVHKTVVGAINELDDKVKDIEKSKFIDATIKGTPTINNGQVSNFSNTNYLILPFAFDPKDRAFEINIAFTTGTNVTTAQNLLGGNYCIALLIQNGNLIFRASNNGTSWNVADITTTMNVQPSTNYFVRIVFDKLSYKVLYSTNGEDYNQVGYKVTTEIPRHEQVFIGVGNNQFNPFLGIINLNKTYIKLNHSIVWQGMDDIGILTRADISLSNLDELGEARFDAKQDVLDIKLLKGAVL